MTTQIVLEPPNLPPRIALDMENEDRRRYIEELLRQIMGPIYTLFGAIECKNGNTTY